MPHRRRSLIAVVVLLAGVLRAQDSQPLGDVARQLGAEKAKKAKSIINCQAPGPKQTRVLTQVTQPFSADYSITDKSGRVTGKLYFSAPMLREEATSAAEATNERDRKALEMLNFVRIVDNETRTIYVLMPVFHHAYMEFHAYPEWNGRCPSFVTSSLELEQMLNEDTLALCGNEPGETCKKLGIETVNGRACERWEVTEKDSSKITAWMDQKLHFPIKIQRADDSVMEITNIKEGPQDASLFTVPADHKPFDSFVKPMKSERPAPGH